MANRDVHDRTTLAISVLALLVSIASAGVTAFLAVRAYEVNADTHELQARRYEEQRTITASVIVEGVTGTPERGGRETQLRAIVALQNVGEAPLRGCNAYMEPVLRDLTPTVWYPSIHEIGGLTWALDPGENHEARWSVPLARSQFGRHAIVEFWFVCSGRNYASPSAFVRLDLVKHDATTLRSFEREAPSSIESRASVINPHWEESLDILPRPEPLPPHSGR